MCHSDGGVDINGAVNYTTMVYTPFNPVAGNIIQFSQWEFLASSPGSFTHTRTKKLSVNEKKRRSLVDFDHVYDVHGCGLV